MPHHSTWLNQLYRLTCPLLGDAELLRRWLQRRDEDAFAALVGRHGRMVHGVCRRVLGNTHDAEDAFQAVFLTLARKAAGLRRPEALVGWLHGVAVRLACKARTAASRRRIGDRLSCVCEPRDPHPDPLEALSARELMALIDREIARLPEAYRLPLVLCDLEGRTQPEAARLLGWTLGSLRGRLLRGRERLRSRLARHGIAPAVLTAVIVQGTADAAGLPADIGRLAVRYSTCPTSTAISPSVTALVREGMHGLMLAKLKLVSTILFAVCTLAAGAGLLVWPTATPQRAQDRVEDKPPPAPGSAKPQVRLDRAGDPLPAEAISRLGTMRFRHGGLIQALAFTPDGKTIVSEGFDGLRIWQAASGKLIRRVGSGSAGSGAIDVSPDGKLVAMILPDRGGYVGLLEIDTGKIVRRFSERQAHTLCFSPDGKMVVAVGYGSEIDLWDAATGRALGALKGHNGRVGPVAFSTDGKTLVSGGDDRTIRFWDAAASKELRLIQTDRGVSQIALSADGRLLASLGHITHKIGKNASVSLNEAVIRLWDTSTGKELRRLTAPAKEVQLGMKAGFSTLQFTRDGKTLVTGGPGDIIRIWDTATGREMRQFPGFAGGPNAFALHPEGKSLAVVDGGSTIRLIQLDTGKDLFPLSGHRTGVDSVLLKPGARIAATAGWDGRLRFWDAQTGEERLDLGRESYSELHFLPGSTTYLAAGDDKKLRICDLDTGKEVRILQGWKKNPYGFELSPDGRVLAQIDADHKKVQLINPATGKILHTLAEFSEPFMGMCFSPNGCSLFIWSGDRNVTVWDAATGEKQRQFSGPSESESGPKPLATPAGFSVFRAALSPDGKLLAFGLQSNRPQPGILPVLDATTGKEVRRFTTGTDGVSQLVFSPDGNSLAWGGWREGTVYIGEIATGKERRRFTGHLGRIFSLAFSADGNSLISGSEDTTALIWDLTGRLAMGAKFGKSLSAEELESHWKTLAAEDAAAAYRAIRALAADSTHSIAYLRKRLHAVASIDEQRLKQWIADLDSETFAVREKATSELEKHGWAALPAMRKALEDKPALETRRRLEPLIEKQQREEWAPSAEGLRVRRALEVLERAGTAEAKDVLTIVANGAARARQTRDAKSALERLARAN